MQLVVARGASQPSRSSWPASDGEELLPDYWCWLAGRAEPFAAAGTSRRHLIARVGSAAGASRCSRASIEISDDSSAMI